MRPTSEPWNWAAEKLLAQDTGEIMTICEGPPDSHRAKPCGQLGRAPSAPHVPQVVTRGISAKTISWAVHPVKKWGVMALKSGWQLRPGHGRVVYKGCRWCAERRRRHLACVRAHFLRSSGVSAEAFLHTPTAPREQRHEPPSWSC